jgi:pimeloyl-ACP methyl ester carboxylesterase
MAKHVIDGSDLHYVTRGDGDPLLLLHGGMGCGDDWRHVFPEDPPGYRLIVPDLRGHGRSTLPAVPFTFRRCALDVQALLDRLGMTGIKAIGLSLGAKTLLHLATLDPARVESMVLVSGTPRFPPSLRAAAAQFTREAFERLPDSEREALRATHVHGDDQIRGLYDMMRSFATSDDLAFTSADLAGITARTLIVHGDRDHLYPVELAVELFRGIAGCSLWVVPGGGHGPIFGAMAPLFASVALAHLSRSLEQYGLDPV